MEECDARPAAQAVQEGQHSDTAALPARDRCRRHADQVGRTMRIDEYMRVVEACLEQSIVFDWARPIVTIATGPGRAMSPRAFPGVVVWLASLVSGTALIRRGVLGGLARLTPAEARWAGARLTLI